VVRTKSGSFTENKPSASDIVNHCRATCCSGLRRKHAWRTLLSESRAMGLKSPLNSVLESKLNHDLLQQGGCQAGEATGCVVWACAIRATFAEY
jgi:hypothetical protein